MTNVNITKNSAIPVFAKNDLMQSLEKITGKNYDTSLSQIGVVMFVLDRSSSMEGMSIQQAKKGVVHFADEVIESRYQIGLITFNNCSDLVLEPTNNKTIFSVKVNSISCSGGTDMLDAFKIAVQIVEEKAGHRVIVVATDGQTEHQEEIIRNAKIAHEKKIDIMAINIENADQRFLDQIVSQKKFSVKVERNDIQTGISSMAKLLLNGR